MIRRILEISSDGRRLSLDRGFIVISDDNQEVGRTPIDDVEALIVSAHAATCTTRLISALAERGVPLVICGSRYTPVAHLLPLAGHHAQGDRMERQAAATQPLRKRLWSQIVIAKIEAQAAAIEVSGKNPIPLRSLLKAVRFGDPGNIEAVAAHRYFVDLFGKTFHRRREESGTNSFLNYGYTVLRGTTARAIVAAGLHPSLGLFHKSKGDALRLADDLMEPFRPAIDLAALSLSKALNVDLTPQIKTRLVEVLYQDYQTEDGGAPLVNCLQNLCGSLAQVFTGERTSLRFPTSLAPLPDLPSET